MVNQWTSNHVCSRGREASNGNGNEYITGDTRKKPETSQTKGER